MTQVFEAFYENGVFRPAVPVVGLADGQRVWVMRIHFSIFRPQFSCQSWLPSCFV